MTFGHFDDDAREYVITRPDTPRPWSNYIGSARFGGVVTNNAAGYAFFRSAAQGRLSRFRFNSPPGDYCGRFVYLYDVDGGDFWSNSWLPVAKPLDRFQVVCRHGTGYTVIRSDYAGIRSETTTFAPLGAEFEVWRVAVANPGPAPRRLRVFPFLEPQCNWHAVDDATNLQYTQYIATTRRVGALLDIGSNVNMPADPERFTNKDQARHTFFGLVGAEPSAHDGDLLAFLGPHGRYGAPRAVIEGRCTGSLASGDLPCAALQIDLDLAPGEERVFAVVFGVGRAEEEGRRAVARLSEPGAIDAALAEVKAHWHAYLDVLSARTPDAGLDSMLRTWAPYNNLMTFHWSRTASLVYAGERDGLGFRDSLQDIVGAAALVPEEARERLELLLTGQFSSGGAKPVVQPFHHRPGHETPPTRYRSDDCLWFFNAVPAYVKETGDLAFYDRVLPYADRGEASVLGHLRRALEFNLERSGAHGLPCGLDADWNDCLRLGEKGESVFVAFQLRYGLREYATICGRLARPAEVAWARERLAALDSAIEAHAWDGEWYLRAYRYDGLKFGSRESPEGSIFMNPQAWAVLSGAATGERARRALDAMHRRLATDHGVMLCDPPYVSTDPEVCLARLFNPGMKENGGVFNHTQGWAVLAAAELGLGDRAWDYLRRVLPSSYNDRAELREVEPYVVCQSTHSRHSPRHGAGRVSWLSGSAVWNYVATAWGLLGIRPDYDGLRLDPCLPAAWPGFSARRRFRGATYEIVVRNPQARQKGVRRLLVDGRSVEGNLIPLAPAGATVRVFAEL
jgi:cellobiose phosphorylase